MHLRTSIAVWAVLVCSCSDQRAPRPPALPRAAAPERKPVAKPQAASIPEPRRPFSPTQLRCDRLLPAAVAKSVLGFELELAERRIARAGQRGVVCAHRTQLPERTFTFQVSCGSRLVPAAFEQLRRIHRRTGRARVARVGKQGIETATSYLYEHPHRPCLIQLAGGALRRKGRGRERLALTIGRRMQ